MGDLAQLTDQALVAQLAHIEDAIGATPTFLPAAEGPELLNGALLDLLAQEVNILDELRIRLASLGAASSVGPSLRHCLELEHGTYPCTVRGPHHAGNLMSSSSHGVPAQPQSVRRARAYCGAAHGSTWVLSGEADPPVTVEVPAPDGRMSSRLVHSPRTGRPVKDSQGNYLGVPGSGDVQAPADAKVVR